MRWAYIFAAMLMTLLACGTEKGAPVVIKGTGTGDGGETPEDGAGETPSFSSGGLLLAKACVATALKDYKLADDNSTIPASFKTGDTFFLNSISGLNSRNTAYYFSADGRYSDTFELLTSFATTTCTVPVNRTTEVIALSDVSLFTDSTLTKLVCTVATGSATSGARIFSESKPIPQAPFGDITFDGKAPAGCTTGVALYYAAPTHELNEGVVTAIKGLSPFVMIYDK